MKDFKARCALAIYSGVGRVLHPFIYPYLGYRATKGKEVLARRCERLGKPTTDRPLGTLVWFHAASVGETIAIMPMMEHILSLGFKILLTTGTVTSATLVENRFGKRIIHQYNPLDLKVAVRRFLDYWQPDLALICESEIWPLRIAELARRKIPQILVNAHLSERSYRAWKSRPALAQYIFSKLDLAVAQSETDAQYFRELGVHAAEVSGNLKAEIAPVSDDRDLTDFRAALKDRPVWAAISTHAGEEIIAAEVHNALKNHLPNMLTIIVPRHPERVEEILKSLAERNLKVVRKSENLLPDRNTDILLGDTIGEMGLYLRIAPVAFVGKSLDNVGGHNPLEPALIGSAILSGPNVENFAETYQKLQADQAVRIVHDATQLAVQVNLLLTKPKERARLIENARRSSAKMAGAFAKTLKAIDPFLQPLTMRARLASIESARK